MKHSLKILFAILSTVIISCSKDDNKSSSTSESQSSSYYVKYEASSGGSYYFLESITVTTDTEVKRFTNRIKNWTQTFGPVNKGFNAKITVTGGNPNVKIYVSKDGSPFALKSTGSNTASHIIY